MRKLLKNSDQNRVLLYQQMQAKGFQECYVSDIPDPIFYSTIGIITWFYQPDLMKRKGHIQLTGSIGFALNDRSLNHGISISDTLNPNSGWMISIRLENFPTVMKAGAIKSGNIEEISIFVENLVSCMSGNLPLSIDCIKKMMVEEKGWLYIMTVNNRGRIDGYPFSKAIAALDIK